MLSSNVSEYEKLRQKNIEENKKMLESLGLLRSFKPILEPIKKRVPVQKKPKPAVKRKFEGETNTTELVAYDGVRVRRSLRNKGIEPDGTPLPDDIDDMETYKPKPPKIKRENYFGPPEGIPVGTHWETRMGCSADGVHRPTVAGIQGNENYGCYSIALSGGYEDDIDLGVSFTYTGSGGRDLKGTKANPKNLRTAPQSKDQTFTKMNLALSRNVETRHPVRVIRGYKCPSEFAPEYGYRYDGLYTVEKSWSAVGLSGFIVCKYILKRMEDEAPPPWKESIQDDNNNIVKETEHTDVNE